MKTLLGFVQTFQNGKMEIEHSSIKGLVEHQLAFAYEQVSVQKW